MRVLIDGLSARVGGGLTYMRYMLPALVSAATAHDFRILLSPRYQKDIIAGLPQGIHLVSADVPATPLVRRLWFLRTELPRILEREAIDVLLAVAESAYPRLKCPLVVMARNPTVYRAMQPSTGLGWKSSMHRWLRAPLIHPTLRAAQRVVFVSEAFRRTVAESIGLDASRTAVLHHGISPSFSVAGNRDAGSDRMGAAYLLSVSSIQAEKNYGVLLSAFATIKEQWPELRLIIAGKTLEPATYRALCRRAQSLGIRSRVEFIGEVEHVTLAKLYRGARLFVLPSLRETFGHPLLEAMASGAPVICSDLAVCREICADAAAYFPPDDARTLASTLQRFMNDENLREELSQRGRQRVAGYSWDKAARGLIQLLEEVFIESAGRRRSAAIHDTPGEDSKECAES